MTITIECEWDEADLAVMEIWVEDVGLDCGVDWREFQLYNSAKPFLKEVARWKIEQNRKQTEREE